MISRCCRWFEVFVSVPLNCLPVTLNPGQGNIDFVSLLTRLESAGYQGHYMMAFGDPADKLVARDFFERCSCIG
jgi:hypothetical protein